jgi:hypothetical protein
MNMPAPNYLEETGRIAWKEPRPLVADLKEDATCAPTCDSIAKLSLLIVIAPLLLKSNQLKLVSTGGDSEISGKSARQFGCRQ